MQTRRIQTKIFQETRVYKANDSGWVLVQADNPVDDQINEWAAKQKSDLVSVSAPGYTIMEHPNADDHKVVIAGVSIMYAETEGHEDADSLAYTAADSRELHESIPVAGGSGRGATPGSGK